jgi:3-oxoadipate enol-lactonase
MGVYRHQSVRLFYRSRGRGTPLVMLHGLGSSSADWEYQVPAFARHRHLVMPDFRGFGASDKQGPYTVEQFTRDTWELLAHLKIDRFDLLGYSMGGAVAMQMVLERPEVIGRLVLSNTLPSFRTDTLAKRALMWSRLLVMSVLGPRMLASIFTKRLYPRPEQAELRAKLAKRNALNDRWVYVTTVRNLTRWSVRDRIDQLRLPVLVLAAEDDYFGVDDVEAFARSLPDARLKIFPQTHHGLPMEQPKAYNDAVLEFLDVRAGHATPRPVPPAASAAA